MSRALTRVAAACAALATTSLAPALAQQTPDLCLPYVLSGEYASCRLVVRSDGEPRCICRPTPLLDIDVTGSIPTGRIPIVPGGDDDDARPGTVIGGRDTDDGGSNGNGSNGNGSNGAGSNGNGSNGNGSNGNGSNGNGSNGNGSNGNGSNGNGSNGNGSNGNGSNGNGSNGNGSNGNGSNGNGSNGGTGGVSVVVGSGGVDIDVGPTAPSGVNVDVGSSVPSGVDVDVGN